MRSMAGIRDMQHEILREVLVRVLSAANREGLVSAQALAAGRSELGRGTDDREEGWMAGTDDDEVVFLAGSCARRLIGG
jgi:hypothetical protein